MTAVVTAISLMPNDTRYVLASHGVNSESDQNRLLSSPIAVRKIGRGSEAVGSRIQNG
jgi:hypothetical protein